MKKQVYDIEKLTKVKKDFNFTLSNNFEETFSNTGFRIIVYSFD